MKQGMQASSVLIAGMLGLAAVATPALAQNVQQCPMTGSPSDWGINSIGYVMLNSGGSCLQRQVRNFEFERRTEAGAWEIAADQQSFLRIHIQSRISR